MTAAVWQFEHSLAFLWDWNESGPFPALARAVEISGHASLWTDRQMQHGAGAPVPWVQGLTYSPERGVVCVSPPGVWWRFWALAGWPGLCRTTSGLSIPQCEDAEVACGNVFLRDIVMHLLIWSFRKLLAHHLRPVCISLSELRESLRFASWIQMVLKFEIDLGAQCLLLVQIMAVFPCKPFALNVERVTPCGNWGDS